MNTKKILIVDDSALMRRVLSDIIESDSHYELCGTCKNGEEAWEYLNKDSIVDGILLDINMPVLDGIGLLKKMQLLPDMPKVIIVSTIAREGGMETIQALELGAYDFIQKPDSFVETKSGSFRERLLHAVTQMLLPNLLVDVADLEQAEKKTIHMRRLVPTPGTKKGKRLIVIACSTGGPKALQAVIPKLPSDLQAPVVIVQHMPEGFTASLARRLNDMSSLSVKEAEEGEELSPGHVYLARGGKQLKIQTIEQKDIFHLTDEDIENRLKPCADLLFDSLQESDYEQILCVILTGMGADGTRGIQKLDHYKQLTVIAQDEETSLVYGMPRMIALTGLVNQIASLDEMADAIVAKG